MQVQAPKPRSCANSFMKTALNSGLRANARCLKFALTIHVVTMAKAKRQNVIWSKSRLIVILYLYTVLLPLGAFPDAYCKER